jgi:hypothetical protein
LTEQNFPREVIDLLDRWVNELAVPFLPPRVIAEDDKYIRLEFSQHIPHAVMVGKLVRAVSGIRAALVLAELGYIAECASILRIVSDFCTEVSAIAEALNRGGEEYAAAERTRYVSRKELMKAEQRLTEGTDVDGEQLRIVHDFLNMASDSYVHGAYESTMELFDLRAGRFVMRGHPHQEKRTEFVEAVFLRLHEVVVAIELTAAVTANGAVFHAARQARRTMDASDPWRRSSDSSA